MKYYLSLLFSLLLVSQVLTAQIPILDEPANELDRVLNYKQGYYIDQTGTKHEGWVKIDVQLGKTNMKNGKASLLSFKKAVNSTSKQLSVDEVKAAKIGNTPLIVSNFPNKFFPYKLKKDFLIEDYSGKIQKYTRIYAYHYGVDTLYKAEAVYIKDNQLYYIPTYYSATSDAKKVIWQLLGKDEDLDDFFDYMENAFKRKKNASISSFFRQLDLKIEAFNNQ